jgi:hypothetical protein
MTLGSGLSFQSYISVSFAPAIACESTLEPRRPGYIGRRLRPLLISELPDQGLGVAGTHAAGVPSPAAHIWVLGIRSLRGARAFR